MKITVNDPCPCGSTLKYKKCCQIYHQGAPPETALLLMKARYSAYAAGDVNFILATTHPEHPDARKEKELRIKEIKDFMSTTLFKKLVIEEVELTEPLSYVTFRVYLEQGGKPLTYAERSSFKKHEGRWCYLAGELKP